MDKILQKLHDMEDDIALVKEEVSTNKLKVVKLERRLKESQDKIERLESEKTTNFTEPNWRKTGSMNKEITAIKKKCEDVNDKCERVTKLQHILNSFILKSCDSSEWQTGMENLQKDFRKLSETVTELQTAMVSSKKVDSLQKNFSTLSKTVKELQAELKSSQKSSTRDLVRPAPSAYFSMICREVTVVQESGIVMYTSQSPSYPVGQYISAKPLTKECPSFSFKIMSPGRSCTIAIGVCPRGYPPNQQPGWKADSVAYHADDGGIFHGHGHALKHSDRCTTGDVMKCQLDFSNKTIIFFKNGTKVFTSLQSQSQGNFNLHAAVGLHSPGEVIMLLESEPWRM